METVQGIKTGIPNEIFAPLTHVRSRNGFHLVYQRSVVEYLNYHYQTVTSEFYLPKNMEVGYTFSILAYAEGDDPRFSFQLLTQSDEYHYADMTLCCSGTNMTCKHRTGYWDLKYAYKDVAVTVVSGDYMFPQIHVGDGGLIQFFYNGTNIFSSKDPRDYDYFKLNNNISGSMRILEIHYTQDFSDQSNLASIFGVGMDIPPIPGVIYPGSACTFRGTYSYAGSAKQPIRARLLRQYSESADKANNARAVALGTPHAVQDRVNITMRVLATTVLLLADYATEPVSFDNRADTSNMKVSFDNINIWDAHIDTGSYIHKFWVGN